MEDLISGLGLAFQSMASVGFFLALAVGILNGIVFAVLPGLNGSVGIALMIPFTFGMEPTHAMALFVGALAAQNFAGSITAILINLPGSSPSAATTFDGYPLARQGRGGFAIGISASASFLGTLFGVAVIIVLFPVLRSVVLSFSFPELMMLGVLGLTAIALASRGAMLKGIVSGLLGLLISFVGFAPVGGEIRYVFGQLALYDGISVLAVLIGLFAVTEGLRLLAMNERIAQNLDRLQFGRRQVGEGIRYTLSQPGLLARSSMLGAGIGLLPAVGGTIASFLAYFQAAKTVKNPRFGRGDPRGVLAPEAANDAKDAGSAVPSLAFGIPGSSDWAIVLGAMIIHGVTPGPNLIRDSPELVWTAIIVIVMSSGISSVLGVLAAPRLIQITKVRPGILAPIVIVLAIVGAFAMEGRPTDILIAGVAGIAGYAMRVVGMPIVPLVLGLLLGPMVERSYLQTLTTFDGPAAFFTRPISLGLLLLTLAIIGYEIYSSRRAGKRSPEGFAAAVAAGAKPSSLMVVGAIAAVALFAIFAAFDFNEDSRTFPILIGALLFFLCVIYLVVAIVPGLRRRVGGLIADSGSMEYHTSSDDDEGQIVEGVEAGTTAVVDAADTAVGRTSLHHTADDETPAGREEGRPGEQRVVSSAAEAGVGGQPEDVTSDAQPETVIVAESSDTVRRRLTISILLTAGLCVGSLLISLAVTVPIVLVLFMRVVARVSWRATILVTVITCTVLYLLFVTLLRMDVTAGILIWF